MALLPPMNPTAAQAAVPQMTPSERREASILILDSEAGTRSALRQTFTSLDFGTISESPDPVAALQKIQERPFTHLVFDARKIGMSARDFLLKVFELDSKIIAIASSYNPTVDDVFDLLIVGARGYIVKPFNIESVDDAVVMATKGEPLSEAILYAKNRNEALASLIFTALDKLAVVMRQARQFETAKREIPKATLMLRRGVDIGRTFAKGGEDNLVEAMVEFCLERASGPATKLGRFRQRLDAKKKALFQKGADKNGTPEASARENSAEQPAEESEAQ